MDVLPARRAYKMQRGHEWASKTYAACTVAAVHQYITLTVQVTCHWVMVKVLGIREANQVRGEEGGGKTLHFSYGECPGADQAAQRKDPQCYQMVNILGGWERSSLRLWLSEEG
jgi:hypothetical protein